jgi:serine/threonine protein kinase
MQNNVAQLLRRLRVGVDLGFSRWETVERRRSDAEFDFYLARSRGSNLAPNFILKTTTARTSGSVVGAAAVERDRFLGSLLSPRLLPTVDFVRPRLLSATRAQRGCVVVPIFSGRTLEARLAAGETFSSETLDALFAQLASALAALHRVGWIAGDLTPSRVLLADPVDDSAPPTATLLDFSAARRFERPSLLADPRADRFDADFSLPPDVFYSPAASPERDFRSLRRFVERLKTDVPTSAR